MDALLPAYLRQCRWLQDRADKVRNARNLSPQRPFETAWRQTGPTKVYKIEDTQIFGSSLYLTGMWSKISGGFGLFPNGGFTSAQNVVLDTAGVFHNSFLQFDTVRPQKQERLDGSKFFDIGSMNHELKFGFGYRSTPVASFTDPAMRPLPACASAEWLSSTINRSTAPRKLNGTRTSS